MTFIELALIALSVFCAALLYFWLRERDAKIRAESELKSERGARKTMSETIEVVFGKLAGDALSQNNDSFLKLAKERFGRSEDALKNLVEPIQKALNDNKELMGDLEKKRVAAYSGIQQQIQTMADSQNLLKDETGKLVNALRRPQVRGRYGEVTLRKVVELGGMSNHCDFVEQPSVSGDSGLLRPDMLVKMPNKQTLIVDAKMPLDNYLDAANEHDEEHRRTLLKQHAKNTRDHVKKLSEKQYWEQVKQTPEFVVMFISGDQFLNAALEHDPGLLEYAMKNKVILTTPSSLMGLLRAVAYGWQQEEIADNLTRIHRMVQDLYNRTGTFVDHINKMGKSLKSSVESYNKAVGSFDSRLFPVVRELADSGVSEDKVLADTQLIEINPRLSSLEPEKTATKDATTDDI